LEYAIGAKYRRFPNASDQEYLEPKHHDNEGLLDRLVEVLERPSVLVAVDRLRRGGVGQ